YLFHNSSPTETSTLSLHDALPIWHGALGDQLVHTVQEVGDRFRRPGVSGVADRAVGGSNPVRDRVLRVRRARNRDLHLARCEGRDRKSTRLNSSHVKISYAVFCLK